MSLEEREEVTSADPDELAGRLTIVEAENDRLRREYTRARKHRYRRTALGLGLVGAVALAGAALLPGSRTLLLSLGGIGIFAAVLTFYLTPDRVVTADVGERVYRALAENGTAMVGELGLDDAHVYVPTGGERGVRLYVPQTAGTELPSAEALGSVFVVTDEDRGLSLRPTGETLFGTFERGLVDELAGDPPRLADQLADGLVEEFELVRSASADAEEGRLTVGVRDSTFGPSDRFDHPVPSFVAVGVARALAVPVRVSVRTGDEERADYLVTCTWDSVEGSGRGTN